MLEIPNGIEKICSKAFNCVEGVVKIIDFDSSRQYKEESENDTRLLGTEKYAAPEQYGFSQTDCRSDIYSLGVVFGRFPEFASKGRRKRWKKLVEKCTLFAPESRFQTVTEVKRELRKVKNSEKTRWGKLCATVVALLSALTRPAKPPQYEDFAFVFILQLASQFCIIMSAPETVDFIRPATPPA